MSIPAFLTKGFWESSIHPQNKLLLMLSTALLMAIHIVISTFFIPVGENLRVYFSFLPTFIASMLGGPIMALCYGFCVDILGFILHPSGGFFPGYILSSMLGALIYSLFFFKQKVTLVKLFLCKLLVNLIVNIGLGSLWSAIMFGKAFYYYLAKSIVKNLALLPLEILLMFLLYKALAPTFNKLKLRV